MTKRSRGDRFEDDLRGELRRLGDHAPPGPSAPAVLAALRRRRAGRAALSAGAALAAAAAITLAVILPTAPPTAAPGPVATGDVPRAPGPAHRTDSPRIPHDGASPAGVQRPVPSRWVAVDTTDTASLVAYLGEAGVSTMLAADPDPHGRLAVLASPQLDSSLDVSVGDDGGAWLDHLGDGLRIMPAVLIEPGG